MVTKFDLLLDDLKGVGAFLLVILAIVAIGWLYRQSNNARQEQQQELCVKKYGEDGCEEKKRVRIDAQRANDNNGTSPGDFGSDFPDSGPRD